MKNLEVYKTVDKDKITYFYYKNQTIYVSKKCYINAFFIVFGVFFICYQCSIWYWFGVDTNSLLEYYNLALVIFWIFWIKRLFKNLEKYGSNVPVLKKVRVEYKDGTISEETNF